MKINETIDVRDGASKIADFILHTQRSFLLNLANELNKGNLSYAQFFLLGTLANKEFLTMSDIAKKMGHSTAAATGLVDRLEKLGYLQRFHASDDRRRVMVHATKKGIEFVHKMRQGIEERILDILERMKMEDQHSLVKSSDNMTTMLKVL